MGKRAFSNLLLVGIVLALLGTGGWLIGRQVYCRHCLDQGQACLERDHCPEALAYFQSCLAVRPGDAEAVFLTARAARRLGDFDLAESFLNECQTALQLADKVALERVLLRVSRGEVDAVGAYCRRLLEQDHPEAPLISEALIKGYLNSFRLGEAMGLVDHWLQRRPDHPQALYLRGLIQNQGPNQQETAGTFRRVLELDPERADVRFLLVGLLLDLGQVQEALPHLQQLRQRRPQDLLVKVRLARCLDLLGRQGEAESYLDEVLDLQPELAPALLERGKLALRAGEPEKAEAFLQRACALAPGDYPAHYQLLQCLRQRGKTAEVQAVRKHLSQIEEDLTRLRDIATRQMSRTPHDPSLHAELGAIFLRSGAQEEGLRWLHGALKLDPGHAAAHKALAAHYQQVGQLGRAASHRQLANPEAP